MTEFFFNFKDLTNIKTFKTYLSDKHIKAKLKIFKKNETSE